MEHQESLESSASICHFPDPVHNKVHDLLANGVEAPGVVVGGVLLTRHHLLGMEQLPVHADTCLVHYSWLQVNKHCTWHVFAATCHREEGCEAIVMISCNLVTGHGPIWLDTVLHTVELPAGIAHLDSGLAHVYIDNFTLETK